MHKVLKATFLPLPTTKSSFLIRHKELGILAEKRAGLKPNPPSRGNGPAVGGGNVQESQIAGRDLGARDARMRQDASLAKCMALQRSSGLWMARLRLGRWQQQFCLVASVPTRVIYSALQLAR